MQVCPVSCLRSEPVGLSPEKAKATGLAGEGKTEAGAEKNRFRPEYKLAPGAAGEQNCIQAGKLKSNRKYVVVTVGHFPRQA